MRVVGEEFHLSHALADAACQYMGQDIAICLFLLVLTEAQAAEQRRCH